MPKKKGKKGKKKEGPDIRTTQKILNDRAKMLCPRLGDCYTRTIHVEEILEVRIPLSVSTSLPLSVSSLCLSLHPSLASFSDRMLLKEL
jgi:hypothetical protein